MSTLRQKEANRRNSQKSTGPTSVTGKAASSMNALKTGIHAKSHIIPTEKRADLEQLTEEYYQRFQPNSPEVRCLVDDLIRCEWTLRRLDFAEAQAWEYQNHDIYRDPEPFPLGKSVTVNHNSYSKLQYRLDATRRAFHRTLLALKQLQAEAAPTPAPAPAPVPVVEPAAPPSLTTSPQTTSPQIGFVPPTPSPAPLQPALVDLSPDRAIHKPNIATPAAATR
jgi:hypothetical protein